MLLYLHRVNELTAPKYTKWARDSQKLERKDMKVIIEATRKEMDAESLKAVKQAIELVANKRVKGMGWNRCHLRVVPGCNIYSTLIDIRDNKNGENIAFFSSGRFYNVLNRSLVELE